MWFQPGGGTFRVFFDGSDLSWILASRDNRRYVSNSASANSNSTKCTPNTKAAFISTGAEEEPAVGSELTAYPNPVTSVVHLTMDHIETYKMIMVYDLSGKSYPVTSIVNRDNMLEIDMSQLPSGPYYIRVVLEDTSAVVPVIKH